MYLVLYRDLLKLGHGDGNRLRAHLAAGCEELQVLRAPREQIVAERHMKRHHLDVRIDPALGPVEARGNRAADEVRLSYPGGSASEVSRSPSSARVLMPSLW